MKWWLMGWVMVVAGAALAAKVEPPKPGPGIFFVATNGNDTWSGKLAAPNRRGTDGPLAMPAAGVKAAREFRKQENSKPASVYLRGGLYCLNEPLVLTPEDS